MFSFPEVTVFAPDGVPGGMPEQSGVSGGGSTPVQSGMPATSAVDATELERQLNEAKAAIAETQSKYEKDLRQMQSSLQSGFSKQQQEWQKERDSWRQRVDEIQTKDLDEGERTKYELQRANERLNEVQSRAQELEAKYQQESLKIQYANQFIEMGVNPKSLILGQGLEELVASGWANVMEELQTLRQSHAKPAAPATPPTSATAPQAPNVVTGVSGSPTTGVSIEKMIEETGKRIGRPSLTEDEFWKLVENQQIPFDADSVLRAMSGQ